jgi:hypothetical protein
MIKKILWVSGVFSAFFPLSAMACATCGCSLTSDATSDYMSSEGWRVNMEYDYIDQSQLRTGSSSVSPTQAAQVNYANGDAQEIERRTINRYWNLDATYHPDASWQFSVLLPYLDRTHGTYGNAYPDQINAAQVSDVSSSGIGDMQLVTGYQGFLPTHNLGVQLGVKLPTGNYGGQVGASPLVGRNPVMFATGPNAGGALDTSLQPGTGSTDIIVGAYYYAPVSQNFDAFITGRYQVAMFEMLDQLGANFRPGNLGVVSAGLRYEKDPLWTPQLQINFSQKSHDQGALADTTDTAGTVLYLSPGLSHSINHTTSVYSYLQLPIYSQLQGYQLFPRWTMALGASMRF